MMQLDLHETAVLVAALTDAIDYREDDGGHCGDCTTDEMCEDHVHDQELADQYHKLLTKVRS